MTLQEYYTKKRDELMPLTDNASYDIKLLICNFLQMNETAFFMNMHLNLLDDQLSALDSLINRRISGEPLQYILGKWHFMKYEFYVSPDCLIPRQDTETLVECALKEILRHNYSSVLDICTGSGCIAISIAKECGVSVTASDISVEALNMAKKNAILNNADVNFLRSDLFNEISGKFDVITANPPYLTLSEMNSIPTELKYEPYSSLFGGDDGLDFYRRISGSYSDFLTDNGILLLEIGESQGEALKGIFRSCEILTDICGKDRVALIRR